MDLSLIDPTWEAGPKNQMLMRESKLDPEVTRGMKNKVVCMFLVAGRPMPLGVPQSSVLASPVLLFISINY